MTNVERWDTHEIALRGTGAYANPFRDVELSATFAHPASGASLEVPGFYDGEATWRVRFLPLKLGEWTYATRSNDPGLDGRTGGLRCVAPEAPYLRGPLRTRGFHFVHADGTPRYLISTRLSCHFAGPEVWGGVVEHLRAHHLNRVLFMLGGIAGTTAELFGPATGGEEGPDFWAYNVERWRLIDTFVDTLRRADLLAAPYFYYFNDKVQRGMTVEQDRAYLRYGMARFGAYANVLPVLSNEVEQKRTDRLDPHYNLESHAWANQMGALLRELAVFGQPVTVHNPLETEHAVHPSFYTLLQDWQFPWADYMLRQLQLGSVSGATEMSDGLPEQKLAVYNARGFARNNELVAGLRRFGIPVVNEEPGYEMRGMTTDGLRHAPRPFNSQTADTMLDTFWTAATGGGYAMWGHLGTYLLGDPLPAMRASEVPGHLRVLHEVISALPYQEMVPSNGLVSAAEEEVEGVGYRTTFCLAQPGEAYLVFSRHGGPLTLDLAAGGRYVLTQVDPRSGTRTPLGEVDGGPQTVHVRGAQQVLLAQHVSGREQP
jgi:hypothetical protein